MSVLDSVSHIENICECVFRIIAVPGRVKLPDVMSVVGMSCERSRQVPRGLVVIPFDPLIQKRDDQPMDL